MAGGSKAMMITFPEAKVVSWHGSEIKGPMLSMGNVNNDWNKEEG